jgi:hypothetical protein
VPDTWISDEMRAAVGTELGRTVSWPIAASDIRRWAQAVYHPEPPPRRFWDEEYARTTRHGGIVAPEDFNPFAWMTIEGPVERDDSLAQDAGPERILGIARPGTQFMLNGGMDCAYTGVPMRVDDVITSVTSLAEYSEREGRLGLMLFTTQQSQWFNQRGEQVKTSRMTLIRY